jgi:Fe2+ or Zn2+ uptake regulation protein
MGILKFMSCSADPTPIPSLRSAGMRHTPKREAILQVLQDADRPLTVEEIWAAMAEPRSGVPTVYRNLERFNREGWIESILGEDQVMRFVRCRSRHHHHHLSCERCGRMVEVEICGIEPSLAGMAERSGFLITRHQLSVFGICPRCQAGK